MFSERKPAFAHGTVVKHFIVIQKSSRSSDCGYFHTYSLISKHTVLESLKSPLFKVCVKAAVQIFVDIYLPNEQTHIIGRENEFGNFCCDNEKRLECISFFLENNNSWMTSTLTHTPTRGVTLYIVYKEPRHHHRRTFICKIIRFCSYFINKLHVFPGEPAAFFISFQIRLLNYQYKCRKVTPCCTCNYHCVYV